MVRNVGRDSHLPAALWHALAALKCLTKLVFLLEDDEQQRGGMYQQLSLLRNIRCNSWLEHNVNLKQSTFPKIMPTVQVLEVLFTCGIKSQD